MTVDESQTRRLYGRRQGHPLRKGQQALMERLLPRLRLDPDHLADCRDALGLFEVPVREVWLEVGFGSGEHLEALARANPEVGLIGCEPFINGMASLLSRLDAAPLPNLRLVPGDARDILDALPDGCLTRVFVLFPDPWHKKRHFKRRFIQPQSLDVLARVLVADGELRVASDIMPYIQWTLVHTHRHPAFAWTAERPDDWRHRPEDAVPTRYEQKALKKGSTCVYLSFRRNDRAA